MSTKSQVTNEIVAVDDNNQPQAHNFNIRPTQHQK